VTLVLKKRTKSCMLFVGKVAIVKGASMHGMNIFCYYNDPNGGRDPEDTDDEVGS